MSIPVLVQVYDEMRRLAIAGSAVAPGDFRLKKLIAPLQQAGEKAPVFGRVAQAAQAVVESNEKTASTALLELTTLVNAILYTQGQTTIAGELTPLETTDLGGKATQSSARVLKQLLEALSSTGSGRLELVRDAFERGMFKDLRLVKPALAALDDPYPEIGQFIAKNVLPLYGKAIVPELREKLDMKGRGGNLLRLQLLHQLDPQGSRDLIQQILDAGSKELKVAAIECLGTSSDDLAYLLEQSKSKAKDVRAAAFRAMTAAGTSAAEVMAALKKAIDGPDLELIVDRVKWSAVPQIREYVLEQAEKQLEQTLKGKDAKLQGPAIIRMQQLLLSLDGARDPKAEAFVLRCFENAPKFAAIKAEPSGSDLNELVAHVMGQGTAKMQQQLVGAYKTLSGRALTAAIFAARALMNPAEFYEEFSPVLKSRSAKRTNKGTPEAERAVLLLDVLTSDYEQLYYRHWMHSLVDEREQHQALRQLDPRWLDAAVEAQSLELVCQIARPGHAAANQFLSDRLEKLKKAGEAHRVLQTMVRINHPQAADSVIDDLKRIAKETSRSYYCYWYARLIPDLPKSDAAKLEQLLPTLPDKMVDQLMDSVLALKNKSE